MPTGTGKTVTLFSLITSYQWAHPEVGRLVYCTRTVPEMSKALEELRKVIDFRVEVLAKDRASKQSEDCAQEPTGLSAGHILAVGLSARRNMCVHPEVSKEGDRERVDEMCRQLTAPWAREKGNRDSLCTHFEKYETALAHQSQLLDTGIYTIEDLRAKGLESGYGWCPYYAARRLIQASSVVVLNYQYVLDPKVSLASSLGGAPSLPGARANARGGGSSIEPSIVVFDEVDSADEEALLLELLQVSTKLERRGGEQHAQLAAVQNVPGTDRQSIFGSLLAANAGRVSVVLAVVVPHVVAFSIALFLRRRAGGPQKTVEVLQEEEQLEPPRSLSYIVERVGPMWIIHLLGIFSVAAVAPSIPYMYLNYFARQHAEGPTDCAVNMASLPCSRAATDAMQLAVVRGLAGPVVQFLTGPTLGAISDSLGRRPAILAIRISMAITSVTSAAVVWFNLSAMWDFWIGFLALIPVFAVPTAWYIDRVEHAPSIVRAITFVEGTCILSGLLGIMLGSVLSMRMAFLVGMLGKLIDLFLAIFCLPESLRAEQRIPFSWSLLVPTTSFHALVQNPLVQKLTAIGVIDAFHYTGWLCILARFLQQHFAWSRHDSYLGGLLDAVSAIAWMAIGVNLLLPALGRVGVLATSTISVGLASVIIMLATRPWHIYLESALFGGLPLMSSAVLVAIIGKASSAEQQGMLQSTLNLVTQISGALGGACFSIIYQFLDPTAPGAPKWKMGVYVLYGVVFIIPSLLLTFSLRKEIEEPAKPYKSVDTR
eukprot:s2052_g11.t1